MWRFDRHWQAHYWPRCGPRRRRSAPRSQLRCRSSWTVAWPPRCPTTVGLLRGADRTAAGANIDLVQYLWRFPELGRHLHHDAVLVLRLVDDRYLPLPKGIVKRIVDLADGKPEARRSGPVDDQIGFEPPLLLVEIDVGQQRQTFERRCDLRRPLVELAGVFAEQCVLVSGVAGLPGDSDILIRPQIERRAGNLVELGPQPVDDLLGRCLTFRQRL